jgi:hypothetical protein
LIPFSFFNNCTIMVKIHSYSVERNYDSYTSIRQLVQLIPDLSSKLLIVCLPASPLPTSPCFTDCCIFFLFSILFWFPSSSFTHSYPVLFKVLYYSFQANVLCPPFHSLQGYHPHV